MSTHTPPHTHPCTHLKACHTYASTTDQGTYHPPTTHPSTHPPIHPPTHPPTHHTPPTTRTYYTHPPNPPTMTTHHTHHFHHTTPTTPTTPHHTHRTQHTTSTPHRHHIDTTSQTVFPPQALESLGLDAASCSRLRPGLVLFFFHFGGIKNPATWQKTGLDICEKWAILQICFSGLVHLHLSGFSQTDSGGGTRPLPYLPISRPFTPPPLAHQTPLPPFTTPRPPPNPPPLPLPLIRPPSPP